jgi:hypothetical protein
MALQLEEVRRLIDDCLTQWCEKNGKQRLAADEAGPHIDRHGRLYLKWGFFIGRGDTVSEMMRTLSYQLGRDPEHYPGYDNYYCTIDH